MNLKYVAAAALMALSSVVITSPAEAIPVQRSLSQVIRSGELGSKACVDDVYIISLANGLFVSAEMSYNGGFNAMLRARAFDVGPWERFRICMDNHYTYLRSQDNGLLVRTEHTYTRGDKWMLRAQSDTVGSIEDFTLNCTAEYCTIRSRANGLYVSAELSYNGDNYGMLRARASEIGPWEKFW